MRLQTGSTTATATMAYTSVPLPASPTLTNPDMILPYGEYDSTPSPPQLPYRSGSPSEQWNSMPGDMQFSIGNSHSHMGLMTPTTPIIYGNGTMLSDIGEVTEAESTPGRKLPGPAERRLLKQAQQQNNSPIRSSPTMGYEAVMKRAKMGTHQRKISVESTSTVTSEGQAAELFKDFDDGVSVDDSVFQGDDEESVADSYSEEVISSETQRLARKASDIGQDEDRNSSAALSRRAEQILLNAKKRLNNMEGNLTRARSSLHVTPSSSISSIHSSSPLSRSTPSPPQNGQELVTALGLPPSKHRQLHTPVDSPLGSPGHARVYSENSIKAPFRGERFPVRASSAAARYMNRTPNDSSQKSPPLSQTPETNKEESRAGTRSGFSSSLSRHSPPHGIVLEPLSEDDVVAPDFEADHASIRSSIDGYLGPSDDHRLTRSASSMQMRDLKDQMHDLKGRLSVLRDRARDDNMKRRSLQSLRTPSPFTAAEQWYTGSKNYNSTPPLSADAGVAQPPWNQPPTDDAVDGTEMADIRAKQPQEYEASDITSVYEDVPETVEPSRQPQNAETAGEDFGQAETDAQIEADESFEDEYNDEIVDREEVDDYESDASLYHDTMATPISHEDREDAFDYEHFFLHSAMGTISQQRNGRRDSVGSFSSEDSVETTRGPIAPSTYPKEEPQRASLGHFRSESMESISTVASFATATEGHGSGNEDESGYDGSSYAVQQAEALEVVTPNTAKRFTFGSSITNTPQSPPERPRRPNSADQIQDQRNGSGVHRPSIASFESFESTGTTRSFPLVNKPKSQQTISTPNLCGKEQEPSLLSDSTTLASGDRLQPSPVHMLARDDQILVERLVASLGKCVLGLQEAGRASYDGRVWRRRLDAARRVLEGEEGAV